MSKYSINVSFSPPSPHHSLPSHHSSPHPSPPSPLSASRSMASTLLPSRTAGSTRPCSVAESSSSSEFMGTWGDYVRLAYLELLWFNKIVLWCTSGFRGPSIRPHDTERHIKEHVDRFSRPWSVWVIKKNNSKVPRQPALSVNRQPVLFSNAPE